MTLRGTTYRCTLRSVEIGPRRLPPLLEIAKLDLFEAPKRNRAPLIGRTRRGGLITVWTGDRAEIDDLPDGLRSVGV